MSQVDTYFRDMHYNWNWQEVVMDYKIRTILEGEDSLLKDFLV